MPDGQACANAIGVMGCSNKGLSRPVDGFIDHGFIVGLYVDG